MNEKRTKNGLYSRPIWANLPDELLIKICKRLKYSFQVGHFRAVCSSWRSAVPPPNKNFPSNVSNYIRRSPAITSEPSSKIRRLVCKLELAQSPPNSSRTSYLIAVEEFRGKLHLLNPITGTPISSNFPRVVHLNKFRVSVLHKLALICYDNSTTADYLNCKAVYLHLTKGRNQKGKPTAVLRKSGKLWLFTGETKGVKVYLNELMDCLLRNHNLNKSLYHDVVKYKDKWCAVDQYGRAVILDSCLNASLVTNPLFLPNRINGLLDDHKSYLVKSSGDAELFLVDRYLDNSSERTNYDENSEVTKEPVYDMAVRFRVYKLDEEEHCWKEVSSLNDHIIFVGADASFWSYCVSAKDFPGCRGNLIFFTDQFRKAEDGDLHDSWDELKHEKGYSLGGFHIENAFLGPLACFPGYTDFFWPPPN